MKNLIFSLSFLFSSFSFLVAQPSVYNGKVNPLRAKGTGPHSVEELVNQLTAGNTNFVGGVSANSWINKVWEGVNYNIDRVGYLPLKTREEVLWLVKHSQIVSAKDLNIFKNDILSSGSLGTNLFWIDNPAEPEYYLVYFNESGEFLVLAKWDCLNPVCDLRKKTAPPPAPAKPETKEEEDLPYIPSPVQVGGYLASTGTEYRFTESQYRFFLLEKQEDMYKRTYRPWRGRSCSSVGYGYDVQRYAVFQQNPPRHGGKKYYGHRKK